MEHALPVVTDTPEEVDQQRRHYSHAIGFSTPRDTTDDIVAFASDAKLPQFYLDNEEDFWYEMLDKEGLSDRVGAIVDTWAEVRYTIGCNTQAG